MDKLGIKATFYDLLGYIIPGAFVIVGIWFTLTTLETHSFEAVTNVKLSWPSGVMLIIFSYIAGHIFASFSSLLFENKYSKSLFSKIYKIETSIYDTRTTELFGTTYLKTNDRILTSYCQTNYPIVYDTAFIFLSIYGLSRNIATGILVLMIIWFFKSTFILPVFLIFLITFFLMVHNYFRFRKYFILQIASALLLEK
ncbi:MAG: hypothetical protein GX660_25795 [Clostridiaceae bacterium]|nr:hypothetical protein [Clostridiaceae bacterium]